MYKLKHIPTGLYFCYSRKQLSVNGEMFSIRPTPTAIVSWTSDIKIRRNSNVHDVNLTMNICNVFNIPYSENIDVQVSTHITEWEVEDYSKSRLNDNFPILLTPEWFKERDAYFIEECHTDQQHHSNFYSIHFIDYKYSFAYSNFRNDWGFYHSYTDALNEEDNNRFDFISCGMKHVHEIQNLLYALTLDKSYLHI